MSPVDRLLPAGRAREPFAGLALRGTHGSAGDRDGDQEAEMGKRVSVALLGTGFGVSLLLPVVGVLTMFTGGVALAILLEQDLAA
jgi:hypothetical protein